jgi:hypothetical protein
MKTLQAAVILTVILGLGCAGRRSDDRLATSPGGYRVSWNGRPAPLEILEEFDRAVERAAKHLAKYGVTRDQTVGTARSCRFNLVPGYRFKTSASETGWATGQAWIWERVIQLAWDAANASGEPKAPAIGHELGHILFGERFEHGWTPPLVSGSGN